MRANARIFFYVQHLLGVGHQRRAAAISRALCQLGADVHYVSGGLPVPGLDIGAAKLVQLPPLRSADAHYTRLLDENGCEVDDGWRARRRQQLLAAFATIAPQIVVLETFPFGRRMLRFELEPLLEHVHACSPRPRVVCSVRDIVEPRAEAAKNRWMVEQVVAFFDAVLVHSDPHILPFERFFPLAGAIADRLHYTGFVVEPARAQTASAAGRGEVLVSAGGGAVGERLLTTAVRSRALAEAEGAPWRVLVSPSIAEDRFQRLRAGAHAGLHVERNRADFPALLRNCWVSVSQAGYNTMLETISAGARAVVVPYDDGGEREQGLRALAFEERGLLRVLESNALTPRRLAQAVAEAGVAARPKLGGFRIDGARESARLIVGLA